MVFAMSIRTFTLISIIISIVSAYLIMAEEEIPEKIKGPFTKLKVIEYGIVFGEIDKENEKVIEEAEYSNGRITKYAADWGIEYERFYDDKGKLLKELGSNPGGKYSREYIYEKNSNNIKQEIRTWTETVQKINYTNNRPKEWAKYNNQGEMIESGDYSKKTKYDKKGNIIFIEESLSGNPYKRFYKFDANGKEIREEHFVWNSYKSEFHLSQCYSYKYEKKTNQITKYVYFCLSGQDELNRILQINYNKYGDLKSILKTDSNGFKKSYIEYIYE